MIARILLVALCLAGFFATGEGRAHAVLSVAEPADGQALDVAPARATLRFSETVSPLAFRLLRPNGEIVRLGDVRAEKDVISVGLPVDLQAGTSILNWRVSSADGHPVGGTVTFVLGQAEPATGGEAVSLAATTYRVAAWAAGALTLICLVLSVGAVLFCSWIYQPRSQRSRRVASVGAISGILALSFQAVVSALDLTGLSPAELTVNDAISALTAGTTATALGFHATALIIALVCARVRPQIGKVLSAAAGVAAIAGFTVHGHASNADPAWLVRPAIALHVGGALVWLGSFVPLLVALRSSAAEGEEALLRVSRPIFVAAVLLVLTGPILATIQLGALTELWSSAYGVVLLLKLACVMPMYALGAVNRFHLSPTALGGSVGARRWIRKTILAEAVLGAVTIGVLGLWRFTPPPRTMETVVATVNGLQFHAHGVRAMANLTLSPARVGRSKVSVTVLNVDTTPLAAKAVSVSLFDPTQQLEPLQKDAVKVTASTWAVDDVAIMRPGRWTVRIDIYVTDFERVSVRTAVTISK